MLPLYLVQHTFRTYNVLVVDVGGGDVELIREAFAERGKTCTLVIAGSFEAARHLLQSKSFHLLIADMRFHSDDDTAFLRSVRSDPRLRSLPVVVLSGSPVARQAYEAGANAFIAKSTDAESFFSKVKAVVHFWLEVVELPRAAAALK